jgi:Golgi phosphoprotein 3 (GPP34)
VAGAYLTELELSSLIERRGAEIVTTQRRSHPDADLASLAQRIAAECRARSAYWWIEHIADQQPHLRQLERLRRQRLVAEYENRVRGFLGRRRVKYCFAPDWGSEALEMELLAAAVRGQKSDERTIGLLALLCAADLHQWFSPKDATIKRRLEDLVRNHWIANPVANLRWRQLLPPPF